MRIESSLPASPAQDFEVISQSKGDGGFRVKLQCDYYLDLYRMGFGNIRLCLTPVALEAVYDRGWCFQGETMESMVLRTVAFDLSTHYEPEGWIKELPSHRRACAWQDHGPKLHAGFVRGCAWCERGPGEH